MEYHLKIIGILLILLSLMHIVFPRYFDWVNDLKGLSLINRQMIYVHTFFIALALMLMGVLCLHSTDDLMNTNLGRFICLGLSVFWFARLIVQFVGYSSSLWKGKRFETGIHVIFIFLWTYLTSAFFYIYW